MSEPSCSPPEEPRRCPRLGGPVKFSYCMQAGDGKPCFKTLDCWWEIFDVRKYLEKIMSPDDLAALSCQQPEPKVASLLEVIRQAKQRLENR